ncbi:MAG TPA: glycerol kinase GlpK [Acidimicrobiales bacterium]|nr:glycerol kinase GlpK [Acidimicrobiales bacterium]
MPCVIAVDAGTTGIRALAIDLSGAVVDVSYRELTQYFPRPAWVEHDPAEIWDSVAATITEVALRQHAEGRPVAAIGVTNQRETVVAWDRRTGTPLHRAIVWQDRRTAERCDELRELGHLPFVRQRTGLVLDPYFSATKMHWLIDEGGVATNPDLVLGTVDAWVVWNLTGGTAGGVLATEPSNASRTLLLDIGTLSWSEELCELFGVPMSALPELRPSCGRFGVVGGDLATVDALEGVPVSGIAGDQQAALFGQACFERGMAKATYGTGTFVLSNIGSVLGEPAEGLLTTVAWDLAEHAAPSPSVVYALEGAVFSTGSAIQWLRDGLGLIADASETGPIAGLTPDTEGVYFVPAFTGLGSPWWDPYARAAITGLTRGSGKAHLTRAVVESIAHQVRDVVDTMRETGAQIAALRVDGGASVMDLLLQLQADQIRVPVTRPTTTETTALGAATMAGLAEGVWGNLDDLAGLWHADVEYEPRASAVSADSAHAGWRRAVERSLGWALP